MHSATDTKNYKQSIQTYIDNNLVTFTQFNIGLSQFYSKLYIDSLKINNNYYYNLQKLESVNVFSEPKGYLYYNRKEGIIKITQFDNEYEIEL